MKKIVVFTLTAGIALALFAGCAAKDARTSDASTSSVSRNSGKDSSSFMWGRNCHTLLSVAKFVY